MTYFPPPYTPPLEGGPNWSMPYMPADALRAAKRAALWMFVLAIMCVLAGSLFFIVANIPLDQIPLQTREQMEQLVDPASGFTLKESLITTGCVMCIPGIVMGALGFAVRFGRIWAMTLSMILDAALIAVAALAAISSFFNSAAGGLLASAPFLIAGTVMVLMIMRLNEARKAAKAAKAMAAQYQWQYWQMGGGEGEGYGG